MNRLIGRMIQGHQIQAQGRQPENAYAPVARIFNYMINESNHSYVCMSIHVSAHLFNYTLNLI